MNNKKHEFALYVSDLSHRIKNGNEIILDDNQSVHRIHTVLRLQAGDNLRVFDSECNALYIIREVSKKKVVGIIEHRDKNPILKPTVRLVLPLLKKESLAQAFYSCVELGVQEIYLVSTAKTHRSTLSLHELDYLKKIAISAAEQSKNFVLPKIYAPQPLIKFLEESDVADAKIFFDPAGKSAKDTIVSRQFAGSYMILIGPEGDLTGEEKAFLKNHDFLFCALTPTVLRAQQALVVGAGLIRSLCRN